MIKKILFAIVAVCVLCGFVNALSIERAGTTIPKVSVSIEPQVYFVKQIMNGLGSVEVNVMVERGKSPEIYEPKMEQLKKLKDSDIYFGIGMPFERAWSERFKSVNKKMDFVAPLKNGVLEEYLERFERESSHKHHSHEAKHNHAPHIWLSFELSKHHATQIAENLARIDSQNEKIYMENLARFHKSIDDAKVRAEKIFNQKGANKNFLVYHPAFSYLAMELGLNEYSIEKDGKEAKIAHTKEILNIIKEKNIKVIFTQPQSSNKGAKIIADEANLRVEIADPLAENWLENIEKILQLIAKN